MPVGRGKTLLSDCGSTVALQYRRGQKSREVFCETPQAVWDLASQTVLLSVGLLATRS